MSTDKSHKRKNLSTTKNCIGNFKFVIEHPKINQLRPNRLLMQHERSSLGIGDYRAIIFERHVVTVGDLSRPDQAWHALARPSRLASREIKQPRR